jgi:hypothetical protein
VRGRSEKLLRSRLHQLPTARGLACWNGRAIQDSCTLLGPKCTTWREVAGCVEHRERSAVKSTGCSVASFESQRLGVELIQGRG